MVFLGGSERCSSPNPSNCPQSLQVNTLHHVSGGPAVLLFPQCVSTQLAARWTLGIGGSSVVWRRGEATRCRSSALRGSGSWPVSGPEAT